MIIMIITKIIGIVLETYTIILFILFIIKTIIIETIVILISYNNKW